MDQASRQTEILSLLQKEGTCSVLELSARFHVSDETIRRDLKHLESLGYVRKVHGGVRLPDSILEATFRQRQIENVDEKQQIGELAASLVADGMTLFVDGSTTALWIAKHLVAQRNLSVVTNGLEVARELANRNNNRVFLVGGQIADDYMSTFGPSAIEFASQFSLDIAFLGVAGVDITNGYCDAYMPEAEMARAVFERARKRVIVADYSKFAKRSLIQVCPLDGADILVVDRKPPENFTRLMNSTDILCVSENDVV